MIFLLVNLSQPAAAFLQPEECYGLLSANDSLSVTTCYNCCRYNTEGNNSDYPNPDYHDAACTPLDCDTRMAALGDATSENSSETNNSSITNNTTSTESNTESNTNIFQSGDNSTSITPITSNSSSNSRTSTTTNSSTSTTTTSQNSALKLLGSASPDGIPHFTDAYIAQNWRTNDALITNLVKNSLIARLITIAKYILGGVFMLFMGLYVITFLGSANKEEASKKFKDQMIWAFTGFLILALAEPFSQALNLITLGNNSDSLLSNPATTQISATLVGYSFRAAGRLIQYILGGVALLTMGISAFRMITAVGDEETMKNSRKSLVWASIGLLIAGATTIIVDQVIAPTTVVSSTDPLVQHAALLAQSGIQAKIFVLNYVKYFQTFIGAMAVLMLFLAGFKMVSAGGEEEIITKQKKMITWIFLGLGVILISEAFVAIFMPATGGLGQTQIASFSAQLGGFTNFLLTFSGVLAVLAMIVGGLYVSTSAFNAEQAEKGKKIMLAAALGLVLTISAYALVNTVLSSTTSTGISVNVSL